MASGSQQINNTSRQQPNLLPNFIPLPVTGDNKSDNETATQFLVASTLSSVSKQTLVLFKCVKINIFKPKTKI